MASEDLAKVPGTIIGGTEKTNAEEKSSNKNCYEEGA